MEHRGANPVRGGPLSRASELHVRLEGEAGLRIVTSADGTKFLQLRRSSVDGDVVVSREQASTDARAKGGSWRVPGGRQHVELRIVLDHSVAEVFTSDGDALTLRFYPVGTADWQLHVVGGGAVHLRAWELRALVWTT